MKRIVFYCAVMATLLITGGTSFSESIKVGFVEAQKVLELSQAGKQVQEKMEAFVLSRQTIIDLEEKELRELDETLGRQASLLSPEAKRVKQEEFQKKLMAYQKKSRELNQEVQAKKIEALKGFNKKMEVVIKVIAEKDGFAFVLDKGNEGGAVLFSSDSFDITAQVIEQLDLTSATSK